MIRAWLLRRFTRPSPELRGHQGTLISLADPERRAKLRECHCGVMFYTTRHTACHACRQKRPKPAKVLAYPGPRRLPR